MTAYQVWRDEKGHEYIPKCLSCREWLRSSPTYDGCTGICTRKRCAKIRERAEKDRRLGVEPLGLAKCDSCQEKAFTRYYADHGTKRETVAHTVCQKHDDELHAENIRRRKELGLL